MKMGGIQTDFLSSVDDSRGVWVVPETHTSIVLQESEYTFAAFYCVAFILAISKPSQILPKLRYCKLWCLFDHLHKILSPPTFTANGLIFQACFSLSEPSFNELLDDIIIG